MTPASDSRRDASPSFNATGSKRARRPLLESVLLCACLLAAGCATRPPPLPSTPYTPLSAGQSDDIAIHAMGLVGTPYRYGGNTPEGGFDCSGLIGYVYRGSVGTAPPRTVAALSRFGQPVSASDLRVGDLVLFGGNPPSHAGIYVGDGRFVHAPSTGGEVRLDRLDGIYWSRQRLEVRRP
ncbi:C40 family peptidase [Variovorax sp. PBL-E5]|uniref:C40 family peptidase n=1 Tax=Variovorax sp. PBL-E5 TaxID=434014 RepID=UPI0013174225|nr:C40 family peptidase [Variovorax sp. PBL-E5]VTU45484.1 putative endopeptidase YafL precursor [Variovorax sp. PBL-E5]